MRSRFALKRKRQLEEDIYSGDGVMISKDDYFLVHEEILLEALQVSTQCSICSSGKTYFRVLEKHGIAQKLLLICENTKDKSYRQ